MSKVISRRPGNPRVLGSKAFAAISAVEGLKLKSDSRNRLKRLRASGLSSDEKRSEILQAYRSRTKGK